MATVMKSTVNVTKILTMANKSSRLKDSLGYVWSTLSNKCPR